MTDLRKKYSDYSQVGIYNNRRSLKLDKTVKILDGYSLEKRVKNDYKIQVTESLLNQLEDTKILIRQNLVENAVPIKENITSPLSSYRKSATSRNLPEEKNKLLETRKFVQSAPLNRKKITLNLNDNDSENTDEIEKIGEKTIRRKLRPDEKMSMSVDKWVGIHQRCKSATVDSKKVQINVTPKIIPDQKTTKIEQGRSIRELENLVVLDKIRRNNQIIKEETQLKLLRNKRRDEFNRIVVRIREFLQNMEKFKTQNLLIYPKPNKINLTQRSTFVKLYEYA
jgi:hypothetical protein